MELFLDKVYIFNPAYYLRNDIKRAIIGTFDFPNIPSCYYDKNITNIIHPIIAQFFSLFNGNRTLNQCLKTMSRIFDMSETDCYNIVCHYINNKEPLSLNIEGNTIHIPRYVITDMIDKPRTETYDWETFVINCPMDLKSKRMYKPLKFIYEMNFNCYTNCIYCYADRKHPKANDLLSFSQIKKFIKELKSLNVPSLEINGGEILLHPKAHQILSLMSEYDYHPFISTKIPLTEEDLRFLKEINICNIQISLDSICDTTLNQLLHTPKEYLTRMINTINNLDKLGFAWQSNIVLTKLNSSINNEIKPLLSFLAKYENIRSIKINPIGMPMYKPYEIFSRLKVTHKELLAIKEVINEYKNKYPKLEFIFDMPICATDLQETNKRMNFNYRSTCTANQKGLVILPNGDVTICEELYWNKNFLIGNIKEQTLNEIWNSKKAVHLYNIQQNEIPVESACHTCKLFKSCRLNKGVCWKMIVMAYGDDKWYYPDPSCPYAPMPIKKYYYE